MDFITYMHIVMTVATIFAVVVAIIAKIQYKKHLSQLERRSRANLVNRLK